MPANGFVYNEDEVLKVPVVEMLKKLLNEKKGGKE
jgi:hypothetical protein